MKRLIYPALLMVLALASCENREVKEKSKISHVSLLAPPAIRAVEAPADAKVDESARSKKSVTQTGNADEVSKKIIREGEITFETANVKRTRDGIYNSLVNLGGYI